MLRRGTIVVGSLFALLLFAAPGWTQFRGHGPSMGSMSFSHSPGAFVSSSRGFPAFGTGTALSSRGFPAFGTGTFNSTSRNVFVSSAGRVVPTANGLAVVSANGTLMPAGGMVTSAFRSVNPASFVSPLANPIFSQSAYAHTLRHYEREQEWASGFNPYLYGGYGYGGYGYGGYGYGNPYAAYGVPYYGSSASYGAGAPTVAAANNTYTPVAASSTASTPQAKATDALKAFGIPVEFGEVKWPLALRLMPPDTKRDLLDKLESQMKIAANQAINGNASQTLLRETKNTIDSVKWWLRGRRSNMSENTYQDGDGFLRQLEESLRRMDS
jgi:hypothetical protein